MGDADYVLAQAFHLIQLRVLARSVIEMGVQGLVFVRGLCGVHPHAISKTYWGPRRGRKVQGRIELGTMDTWYRGVDFLEIYFVPRGVFSISSIHDTSHRAGYGSSYSSSTTSLVGRGSSSPRPIISQGQLVFGFSAFGALTNALRSMV